MIDISVVIPAKNEACGLRQILPSLAKHNDISEIIVVDDASTDETRKVAEEHGARVISHSLSLGNGAAVKKGAREAGCAYILFMDGDGQHRPADISSLIRDMVSGEKDMVIGARSRAGQANRARGLANRFYNWFGSVVTGQKIKDLTSGFRLVKRNLFLQFIDLLPNGFSYPTTITMAFCRAGYVVGFVPVDVVSRDGKSKIKPVRDGVRFLLIIFKVTTLYSPLKIFFPLALVHFILGIARYVYTYVEMGAFTNMSALLFVTSVHVFLVGLVSEQITTLMYSRSG